MGTSSYYAGTYDIQATNDGATRGENSVDLSTVRSNTNMVASVEVIAQHAAKYLLLGLL